jgi:ribokinase
MDVSQAFDIVVVGGANTDYMVRGPKLPRPGEAVTGTDFHTAPGGKGLNQAAAAARLGKHVALVARVGDDDRGDAVVSRMESEGIATRFIVRDGDARTGVVVVQIDAHGEKQTLSAPGAMARLAIADVEAAAGALQSARALLVSLEISPESVQAAVRLARMAGVLVALDPSPPRPLPDDLLAHVDIIKPDAREAQALTGIASHDRASARAAAQHLMDRGVKVVAIQAGDEGDLLVWHAGECWLSHLPVRSVDATGAGDAFLATLVTMRLEGHEWPEAGRFASAAAALTTTVLGVETALPRRDAIQALLQQQPSS